MMSFQGHLQTGGLVSKETAISMGWRAHGASGSMGGSLVVGTTEMRADSVCWNSVAGVERAGFCLP